MSGKAPGPIGPYSPAVRAGGFVFLSGQIPLDPATGALVEGDVGRQTGQALRNVEAVLETVGLDRTSVVKTTVFMVDLSDFPAMNREYAAFFGQVRPARSTVGAARLPAGATVEIEAVAWAG